MIKEFYIIFAIVSIIFIVQTNPEELSSPNSNFIQNGEQFASRLMLGTHTRKLSLPRGTTLSVTPSITIPIMTGDKTGKGGTTLQSDISGSWIFYITFDDLEMNGDNDPVVPFNQSPFYPFNGNNNRNRIRVRPQPQRVNNRQPRSVMSLPSPESIHGGERAIIMPTIEGLLSDFGYEGRPCLLRAICEVHELPLKNGYGLFGEILTLLFSISESSYAESHMPEYLKAEMKGKTGDCSTYHKSCTKSIFKWEPKQDTNNVKESIKTNSV